MRQIVGFILIGVLILALIAIPQFANKWVAYHERVERVKQYSARYPDKVFWLNGGTLGGWIIFEDYPSRSHQNCRYFHNGREL